jgi:hypothetical protein
MKEVMSYGVAEKEVIAWLDKQHVRPRKREELKAAIESIIESVMDGDAVFNDGVPTYTLSNPVGNSEAVLLSKLTFGNRFTVHEIQTRNKQNNVTEDIGRSLVYVSLATGEGVGVLSKMGTTDFNMAQLFVAFF